MLKLVIKSTNQRTRFSQYSKTGCQTPPATTIMQKKEANACKNSQLKVIQPFEQNPDYKIVGRFLQKGQKCWAIATCTKKKSQISPFRQYAISLLAFIKHRNSQLVQCVKANANSEAFIKLNEGSTQKVKQLPTYLLVVPLHYHLQTL